MAAVLRGVVVLGTAAVVALSGAALLRANSTVRPLWTGPQAVALAQAQLARLQAAEAQAQQALDSLQADVAELSAEVDQANQLLAEVQSEEFAVFGGGFRGRRR